MPTKRNKRSRYSKPALSKEIRDYFESGNTENETIELYAIRTDKSKMQSIWDENKELLLDKFIKKYPGFRPFAWWLLESPEPRQRIGGTGKTPWDAGKSVKPYYDMGVPNSWNYPDNGKIISFDRSNPPTFESEAEYLQRHALLTPIEEKIIAENSELLDPVKLTDIFDFREG